MDCQTFLLTYQRCPQIPMSTTHSMALSPHIHLSQAFFVGCPIFDKDRTHTQHDDAFFSQSIRFPSPSLTPVQGHGIECDKENRIPAHTPVIEDECSATDKECHSADLNGELAPIPYSSPLKSKKPRITLCICQRRLHRRIAQPKMHSWRSLPTRASAFRHSQELFELLNPPFKVRVFDTSHATSSIYTLGTASRTEAGPNCLPNER